MTLVYIIFGGILVVSFITGVILTSKERKRDVVVNENVLCDNSSNVPNTISSTMNNVNSVSSVPTSSPVVPSTVTSVSNVTTNGFVSSVPSNDNTVSQVNVVSKPVAVEPTVPVVSQPAVQYAAIKPVAVHSVEPVVSQPAVIQATVPAQDANVATTLVSTVLDDTGDVI